MFTVIFHYKLREWALSWLAILCLTAASTALAKSSFILFKSGQVRPLALSPDGRKLFVVNTPDNQLEIFEITRHGLKHAGSVPVVLEPVADAACWRQQSMSNESYLE